MPPSRVFNIVSHAVACLFMLAITPRLHGRAGSRAARRSVVAFGLSNATTYAVSCAYHASHSIESERLQRDLRKADRCGIFASIAAAYTPLVVAAAPRSARRPALVTLWSLALGGMALEVLDPKRLPEKLSGLCYLLLGASGLRLLPILRLQRAALRWALLGQLVTGLGAVVYEKKRPDPWPRVVGSHGLWHVLSALGSTASYLAIRSTLDRGRVCSPAGKLQQHDAGDWRRRSRWSRTLNGL